MAKGLFDLSGKVAVVTGGNGGLGLGFATGIAKQGGTVVIWGRNAEKNAGAVAKLTALGGGGAISADVVDVSSEQAIKDGYKAVMDKYGRVDCAIANAGPPPSKNSMFDIVTEDYHKFLNTAMHGAFFTLREGARCMVQRAEAGEPGGSLIFCGSLSMFKGLPGKQDYAGAKGAMGAMVRGMAVELGKYGIRANSIAPGYIKTEMTGSQDEWSPIDKYMAAKTPMARPGYISDFEGVAAFLCSDASSYLSGDTIIIDGASLINM